ncbi:General secretion pathway protein B [Shewanella piezotolerans WP3]|uniref:General secretion pathway protein B n=1 Tax=Shewanella piezotolerans (strain WP3 / JCM 13877) TaxID=225849 RepID=B8CJG1_SHEPW|nr:general secretion pathway protein GspB [Shewanella piezotolerans]ACJ27923.1 General secretion pathway protein B [Shewanella piezotolerans WP3]
MSILLDAVTRDKQQSQAIQHDVVMTPRAPYQTHDNEYRTAKRIALFVGLFLSVIGLAWMLSQVLLTPAVNSQNAQQTISDTSPIESQQQTAQFVSSERPFNAAGVKLAGKVALPVAQAMPNAEVSSYQRQPTSVNETVDNSGGVKASGNSEQQDLLAAVLKAQKSVEADAANRVDSTESNSGDAEPIILGANANQRGQDMLASLQYEVDLAAADVGLDRQAKPQKDNNLVAAFEAALKAVERENSVATPVTQPDLDPIPTTPKSDAIPKYGQLPAGLQLQVPEFNINAHVYSSVADNRWLNVDGKELQQGDMIQGKLTVVEIRPRDVVLSIEGTKFKVPAI